MDLYDEYQVGKTITCHGLERVFVARIAILAQATPRATPRARHPARRECDPARHSFVAVGAAVVVASVVPLGACLHRCLTSPAEAIGAAKPGGVVRRASPLVAGASHFCVCNLRESAARCAQ